MFDEAFEVFWRQRKDRMSSLDLRSMGEQPPVPEGGGGASSAGQQADGSAAESPDHDEEYNRDRPDEDVQRARGASGAGLREVHAGGGVAGQAVDGFTAVESRSATHAAARSGERALGWTCGGRCGRARSSGANSCV